MQTFLVSTYSDEAQRRDRPTGEPGRFTNAGSNALSKVPLGWCGNPWNVLVYYEMQCSLHVLLQKLTTFARHVLPPVCSVLSRECASVSGNMQAVDIGGNHVVVLSLTRLHSPMFAPTFACLQCCVQPHLLAIWHA